MSELKTVYCSSCERETNHAVLHSVENNWESDPEPTCGYSVRGGEKYFTLQCMGCNEIRLQHISWFSEADENTVLYFPASKLRKKPKWFVGLASELPANSKFVRILLEEIYIALDNGIPNLAVMGVRSLLEKMMISVVGDQGRFFSNLEKFESEGYVTHKQRERMEAILEAGHAAVHRDFEPNAADVSTLMDITEHIVESMYIHESLIKALKARTPVRPERVAK